MVPCKSTAEEISFEPQTQKLELHSCLLRVEGLKDTGCFSSRATYSSLPINLNARKGLRFSPPATIKIRNLRTFHYLQRLYPDINDELLKAYKTVPDSLPPLAVIFLSRPSSCDLIAKQLISSKEIMCTSFIAGLLYTVSRQVTLYIVERFTDHRPFLSSMCRLLPWLLLRSKILLKEPFF